MPVANASTKARTVTIRSHVEVDGREIRYRFGCVAHNVEAGGTVLVGPSGPEDPAMLAHVAGVVCDAFDGKWCGCFREIEDKLPALLRVPCVGLVAEFKVGGGT